LPHRTCARNPVRWIDEDERGCLARATWLDGIAKRAIKGAKARLRALGVDPDDPSSDDEDPNFKLS
jgi:hypothetical protein